MVVPHYFGDWEYTPELDDEGNSKQGPPTSLPISRSILGTITDEERRVKACAQGKRVQGKRVGVCFKQSRVRVRTELEPVEGRVRVRTC